LPNDIIEGEITREENEIYLLLRFRSYKLRTALHNASIAHETYREGAHVTQRP